jgi:hypothetical protein
MSKQTISEFLGCRESDGYVGFMTPQVHCVSQVVRFFTNFNTFTKEIFMSTMKLSAKGGGDFFRLRSWAGALLMLGLLLMLGTGSAGAAPLAGTSIGNQASATYLDNGGTSRVTVSNSVSTIVSQVSSATLAQSQTKVGAPGQPISFPHTITNNGNGPETFNLTTANFVAGSLTAAPLFYADANCDGVADNSTAITSIGPIAPGVVGCFVAQGTLNSSGANSTFDVRAQSTISPLLTNTDTAVISNAGVITISKAISVSSGPSGTTPVTYTLTYRNTGTAPVFGLVIADSLQTGVNFAATLNAKLNGTAITANGALSGTTPNRYNLAVSTDNRKIMLVIERIDPNTQGTFTFDTTQTGAGPVNNNNAQYCYLDGTNQGTNPYSPGGTGANLPTTIQPPNSGGTTVPAGACATVIGTGASGNGSGVLGPVGGSASATYVTSVVDTNVTNVTSASNTNFTNTVPFTITTTTATGAVVLNDGTTTNATTGGNGTVGGAGNVTDGSNPTTAAAGGALADTADVNVVANAAQGSVVTFNNWIWNTGTAADTYNISIIDTNNFPAGTTFQFMRSDAVTPLTDSNSDGVLDTGPIPGTGGQTCPTGSPNATSSATTPCGYRVVVRAILPSGGSGGPFNVVVQAASSLTPTATNTVVDRLTIITASTMDLRTPRTTVGVYSGGNSGWTQGCAFTDVQPATNTGTCSTYVGTGGSAGGTGQQATGEATPIVVYSANPGSTVIYKLDVVNTGGISDSYDLAYNLTTGNYVAGATAFTTPASLPATYQVRYFLDAGTGGNIGNCTTLGAQVSNTGVIAAGATKTVCAQIIIPASAVNATYDLYFRAQSPTTATNTTGSSADVLHTQLFINTVRSVTITPNNSGQIFPGGSISYCHTVTNAGNVAETAVTIGNANSLASPWPTAAVLYRDTNNNCTLDAGETTPLATNPANLSTLPMNAGTSQNYIVVVQAPAAATAGQTNVTTVTVTPSGVVGGIAAPAASSATDSTVVVIGQVTLVKSQILDAACSNAMTSGSLSPLAYSQGQIAAAAPGACIIYKVVATNIGTQTVTLAQVFDSTPPNTTCFGTPIALVNNVTANTVTVSPAGACTTPATASLQTTAVSLAPNETVTLYMRVKINP